MITELIRAVITLTGNCEQQIKSPWLLLHTEYVAIENVNTIYEHRSEVRQQMAIKNTVSSDFWSVFVDHFWLSPIWCVLDLREYMSCTVLPAMSDSDVMLSLQSY